MGSLKHSNELIELSDSSDDKALHAFTRPRRTTTTTASITRNTTISVAAFVAIAASAAASNTISLVDDSSDEESTGENEVEFLKTTGLPTLKSRLPSALADKAVGLSGPAILGLLLKDVGERKILNDALSRLYGNNVTLSPYNSLVRDKMEGSVAYVMGSVD
jgi:hypothetical protein